MKIIITGGHHNSALVVAEELIKKGVKVYWIGHQHTMIGDRKNSAEYLEVTQKGIPFYSITAGKLQLGYQLLPHLLRIPIGFIQSILILMKIRPDLVLSFGGYLALPVAVVAYLARIPVITHEQTVTLGLANKLIVKIAKIIMTSFPDEYDNYPREKTVFTGLPLRNTLFTHNKKVFDNNRKTIYITGGKQGSHKINECVFKISDKLLDKNNIIHQCGSNTLYNDYLSALELKKSLGNKGNNYLPNEYFNSDEIGKIYNSADLVVCRAGAHTVYELMVLKKPAILIPIPWTHNDEQGKNAQLVCKSGLGIILSEDQLNDSKLADLIEKTINNLDQYKLNPSYTVPVDGTERVLKEISKYINFK